MTSHRLWLAVSLIGALLSAFPAKAQTSPPPASDSSTPAAASEPIGNVATLTGIATVIRNKNSLPLHLRDDIFLNDQVQTASSSSLGITFNDATTFNLSANAKITIDNYIYEEGGKQNTGLFDIGKGTVAFVAAAVAKTGDMKITTPTSTLGIRGTTGLVEVPEGGAAAGAANGENIKLYPDPDGHVGRIEVGDHMGQTLGTLTQGASGFTVRPGAGGARPVLRPLTIPPQQVARDQGFVRQVHAAQTAGRQIVTEQRAARRASPPAALRPNRTTPPAQPQRQNQAPGPNRQGQPQPTKPGEKSSSEKSSGEKSPGEKTPGKKPSGEKASGGKPGEKTKQGITPAVPKRGEKEPDAKPATPPVLPQRGGAAPPQRLGAPPTLRQGGATPPAAQRQLSPRPAPQRQKPQPGEKRKR